MHLAGRVLLEDSGILQLEPSWRPLTFIGVASRRPLRPRSFPGVCVDRGGPSTPGGSQDSQCAVCTGSPVLAAHLQNLRGEWMTCTARVPLHQSGSSFPASFP